MTQMGRNAAAGLPSSYNVDEQLKQRLIDVEHHGFEQSVINVQKMSPGRTR